MTILMLFVVAISITVMVLRFGLSILDENFVTELSSYYENYILWIVQTLYFLFFFIFF